jgi:Anti-sigma factor NepR
MMRLSYEEPMVNKTRNNPSRSVVVGPGHKEHSADNELLGKVFVRRESGRRQNLALMERTGSAKFSDCSEGVPPRGAAASLLGEHIGRELRGLYAEVVAQPVPDRFLELLNKLEAGATYLEEGTPKPEGMD